MFDYHMFSIFFYKIYINVKNSILKKKNDFFYYHEISSRET